MQQSARILVADDDADLCRLIAELLSAHGFDVTTAGDGQSALAALAAAPADLLLLDLVLAGDDGLVLGQRIRAAYRIPIIMMTGIGDATDRIVGLEVAADDYLAKPFNPRELLARIRAVLRRARRAPPSAASSARAADGWRLDRAARRLVRPDGTAVELTAGELRLLESLAARPCQIVSREHLLALDPGGDPSASDRSIDIRIARLRRKVELNPHNPMLIKTVRHGGYILTADLAAGAPTAG